MSAKSFDTEPTVNQAALHKKAKAAGCVAISIEGVMFYVSVQKTDDQYCYYLETDCLYDLDGLRDIFKQLRSRQTEDEKEHDKTLNGWV